MADGTHIEWTDSTWNIITGCSVVSPGCTNCYAMRLAGTRLKHHPSRAGLTHETKAGPVWTGEVQFNGQWLNQPLSWQRPRRIFVAAHGDLFHESVPDEWIDRVFAVMALAGRHTFQVLTKRADRMRRYLADPNCQFRVADTAMIVGRNLPDNHPGWDCSGWKHPPIKGCTQPGSWPLPNVWLGVSVEDQARADERIPHLLATPAAVRWISAEPLLGPVDLMQIDVARNLHEIRRTRPHPYDPIMRWPLLKPFSHMQSGYSSPGIDWVVAGGESGPGARPMHPDWARSLRNQCETAGVAFYFKQWGAWLPDRQSANAAAYANAVAGHRFDDGTVTSNVGKKAGGRHLDGVLHNGFPS